MIFQNANENELHGFRNWLFDFGKVFGNFLQDFVRTLCHVNSIFVFSCVFVCVFLYLVVCVCLYLVVFVCVCLYLVMCLCIAFVFVYSCLRVQFLCKSNFVIRVAIKTGKSGNFIFNQGKSGKKERYFEKSGKNKEVLD